jgi:cell division protein FtsQ
VEENNLFLRFDNVRVAIGNEEYQDRIAQLPEILKELQGESGTLHLENFTSSSKNVWFQKS